MTTSDLTNFNQQSQQEFSYTAGSSFSSAGQKNLLIFKVIESVLLAAVVGAGCLIVLFSDNPQAVIAGAAGLTLAILLFFINREVLQESKKAANQSQLANKAELYTYLLSNNSALEKTSLTPARGKALQYSQDLIDDYKNIRNLSRTLYYVLQLLTVILSGVTPVLVLVDKLEAGQAWLKWLPVICPAVASIVASIVTSFPFQKNWVAANTAVELLEAEQEKFILGITPPYRCYDLADEIQQQQKSSQAIEYFVVQVNNIHLQQLQQTEEKKQEKIESAPASESKSE
ncbi:MAG: DUF4231 domain-containing protein [Gloeotrichia echinulata GP01]